jgi:flagellar motor switch/type III secretory pathway protein FliN
MIKEPHMDFPDVSSAAASERAKPGDDGLADLTVEVHATVDLAPARVADMQRWSAGKVLPSLSPIDGTQVALRVAGRVVGRGRLLAIDTMLGFEVLELYE